MPRENPSQAAASGQPTLLVAVTVTDGFRAVWVALKLKQRVVLENEDKDRIVTTTWERGRLFAEGSRFPGDPRLAPTIVREVESFVDMFSDLYLAYNSQ